MKRVTPETLFHLNNIIAILSNDNLKPEQRKTWAEKGYALILAQFEHTQQKEA